MVKLQLDIHNQQTWLNQNNEVITYLTIKIHITYKQGA